MSYKMKKKNKIVEILFIMAVAFILIISDRGKVYAADAVVSFGKDSYSVNMDDTFEIEETQTSSDTYGLETDVPVVGSIKKGISFYM